MYLSILIQIIALVIGTYAYSVDVNPENKMLDEIMLIENIVQGVEFLFYFVVAFIVTNIPTSDLAKYRYYDWVITTPLMLITTLLYFRFEDKIHNIYQMNVWETIKKSKNDIIKLVLSNACMLIVGYLQELGNISLLYSNVFGFGFLFYTFYVLYKYVSNTTTNALFWIMFGLWSLYGVAANYTPKIKNTMYNILDVISKNFYGIFLASVIMYRR